MLVLVALYFLAGALIVYVCMFADGNDAGVCGSANRALTEKLPAGAKALARRLLPTRAFAWGASLGDYICNKPNPILQVFYLALIIGGYGFAVLEAYPHIPNSVVPAYHKLAAALGVAWCIGSFFVACSVEAGTLTPDTWRRYDNYKHDDLMYENGREYIGHNTPKLARSKHDSVSGMCVARFDHYCAWLAQPVGERNYRWFLLFVASHAAMLGYASYLLGGILVHQVRCALPALQRCRACMGAELASRPSCTPCSHRHSSTTLRTWPILLSTQLQSCAPQPSFPAPR